MTTHRTRAARNDSSYLVATFPNFPGVENPLLSDEQCAARGIGRPKLGLFDHLTPEERLEKLRPLMDLIVEQIVSELMETESQESTPPPAESPTP